MSWSRKSNVFSLKLSDGAGELEWVSPSSFRFSFWNDRRSIRDPINLDPVEVSEADLGTSLQFSTKYLTVQVEKSGVRLRVRSKQEELLADVAEPRREGGAVIVARDTTSGERFHGLGPRAMTSADLRGHVITASRPFLISSRGYGEYYTAPGAYHYDLAGTNSDRRIVTIQGGTYLEHFFYYGPTPKEIIEEHAKVAGTISDFDSSSLGIVDAGGVPKEALRVATREGSWTALREDISSLVHASLSGFLLSAFDLSPYGKAPDPLFQRAAELGSVLPIVFLSDPGPAAVRRRPDYVKTAEMRERLTPYLVSYLQEARERGYPLLRPLAIQFPYDVKAAAITDEFMLGDELLIAPVSDPKGRQTVYLPMGTWTDFRTNERYKGKQVIRIRPDSAGPPIFIKSGSLVPLKSPVRNGPLALHYFPNLGAEFFLFEEDAGDYSQFHAGPAGDVLRFEIESVKDAAYDWVAHHVPPCRKVVSGDVEYRQAGSILALRPGDWFYDKSRQGLRIRTRARGGEDLVINVY